MTSAVYIIAPAADDFDYLMSPMGSGGDHDEILDTLDGTRRAPTWTPLAMERIPAKRRKHRGRPVDFPSLMGLGLAFSTRAVEALLPLLKGAIEPLSIKCVNSDDEFFAINILDVLDCLDEERAKLDRRRDGRVAEIFEYAFKPNSLRGHHLFTLVQEPRYPVLVSAEFKKVVEESRLVGATFTEVGHLAEHERTGLT